MHLCNSRAVYKFLTSLVTLKGFNNFIYGDLLVISKLSLCGLLFTNFDLAQQQCNGLRFYILHIFSVFIDPLFSSSGGITIRSDVVLIKVSLC